jgi:hypothetical protein
MRERLELPVSGHTQGQGRGLGVKLEAHHKEQGLYPPGKWELGMKNKQKLPWRLVSLGFGERLRPSTYRSQET